jgi:glyoxylase-like metal-dependent hydrolase (beta-lactamase superfamily II)
MLSTLLKGRGMEISFRRWRIGEVTVTRMVEFGPLELAPESLFPAAGAEQVKSIDWLRPDFASEAGEIRMNLQCFLIQTPSRKILVDTCVGEQKHLAHEGLSGLMTGFLDTLAKAGAGPGDIDVVLCTHLHWDHVGWNTRLVDGAWRPTFPNARYLFGREELAFALGHELEPGDASVAESIQPVIAAGLVDLVEMDHRLCDEVRLEPTPGHTPGHVSVWIESNGARAMISGDAIHHPLQFANPDIASAYCSAPRQGCATRRQLFGRLAGEPVLFIGTHFAEPTAGLVARDGEAWRLNAVWDESLPEPH